MIKKNAKKSLLVSMIALLSLGLVSCGGGTSDKPDTSTPKTSDKVELSVKSIKVTKLPTKVDYFVGEEFSAEGGEITATMSDGTTKVVSMTDKDVTISTVNTTINDETKDSETKNVTVRYGKKSASFKINVSYQTFKVTFDLGYEGAQNTVVDVRKDHTVAKPEDPVRENYQFENWYSDSALTSPYDFTSLITADTTIYAKWLENATYYKVSFSLNYKDSKADTVQQVKENDKAVRPTTDPTRNGYAFVGWYSAADGTTEFNFDTTITADTTVYAKWNKTQTGRKEVVFEAEDTNLNGKSGPGLSGTGSGTSMIEYSNTLGASNDRFVGYLYEAGVSLEFQFNSDVATSTAKLVLRLSAELRDFSIGPDSYIVYLNSKAINYSTISFTNVPKGSSDDTQSIHALPFADFTIAENVSLKEGMNTVQLVTDNDDALSGTTMVAKAPLVDCLKVTSDSVINWTDRLGLPKTSNY